MSRDRLTKRQSDFVDHYLDCGNGAEAARKAGYSENCDDETAYENLRKPQIKEAIAERMAEHGITVPRLLTKINEGLDAQLVKIATDKGSITDTQAFDDFVTRHKYIDTALKLLDLYPAEKHEVTNKNEIPENECDERLKRLARMEARESNE